MRRLLATFLLLCLSWQALASAGVGAVALPEHERAHSAMHFLGEAHHHSDSSDGAASLHEDDSPESILHMMSDACLHCPALLLGSRLGVLPPAPAGPAPALVDALRLPPLSGLERPPRPIV